MLSPERMLLLEDAWWHGLFDDAVCYCGLNKEERKFIDQLDDRFVRKLESVHSYADVSHLRYADKSPDPDANGLLVASEKDYDYVDSFFVW